MLSITPILAVGVLVFGHSGKVFDSRSRGGVPCPNSRHSHVLPSLSSLFPASTTFVSSRVGHFTATHPSVVCLFNDTVFC